MTAQDQHADIEDLKQVMARYSRYGDGSGSSIGTGVTFGRIAGRSAAAQLSRAASEYNELSK